MNASTLDPIGVFLAISGAKGEKLLFRYPFELTEKRKVPRGNNPYSLIISEDAPSRSSAVAESDDASKKSHRSSSLIEDLSIASSGASSGRQRLKLFEDKVLANLFNVRSTMCNRKFECKIDDVTFVGHPQLVQTAHVVKKTPSSEKCQNEYAQQRAHQTATSSLHMFHIVFALSGEQISHFVVDSYHRLAQKLAIAVNHEETREGYLNRMVRELTSLLDKNHSSDPADPLKGDRPNPFELVLDQNPLAKTLKQVYDEIVRRGSVSVRINDWVQVSFCLLPKIHRNLELTDTAVSEQITKMRPYHGLLLLESEQEIFADLPIDASPSLVRFIRIVSPLINFQLLAMEAGVTLTQVYAMAGHLIYWAKARLVFPVCETNVYALAPEASTKVVSDICDEFALKFPDTNLIEILSDFSLPLPLRDMINPFTENMDTSKLTQIVLWCLKRNLLIQLHTYVYLIPVSVDNLRHLQIEGLNWVTIPPDVRKKIMAVPAAGGENHQNQDVQTFAKLIPYFRGNAHLEEMMFNVNIKRSQLTTILDKFRDVLITVVHEDPNLPPTGSSVSGGSALGANRHFSVSASAHNIAQLQ